MQTEFDFIHYIKKSFGLRAIGDDCAVLPHDDENDLLVTADLLVEGIDFKLEWYRPEDLGHKALAVSLSDIAAMGGEPVWALLSLGIPEALWETDLPKRFYQGWNELAEKLNVELVGGDISRSPGNLIIDSIVGGSVPKGKAVLRSGAKPGEALCVSGQLGGAAGGLRLLERDLREAVDRDSHYRLLERQFCPTPRIELGRQLRSSDLVSAMIDLSDGLSSDIHHICKASLVGAQLNASLLPIDKNLEDYFDQNEALALALNGGEDFELLFTVPQERISMIDKSAATTIGVITEDLGLVELIDHDKRVILHPSGYRHF